MSIGQWFKNLFSGPAQTDASLGDGEIDIDEARIDAGGSGPLGLPNDPASHADPGEVAGDVEAE